MAQRTTTAKRKPPPSDGAAVAIPGLRPRPTPDERNAAGRAARNTVSRSSQATWQAPPDRADPVDILAAQAESRVADLIPIGYGRMLVSPFTFFRGAAAVMAADLAATPTSGLRVQLCGDAHLSNFGHARSGDRVAISGYLGRGATFDLAIAAFADAYANQNQRDFERLTAAWKANEITVQTGV